MGPGFWTGPLGMSLDGQQNTRRLDGPAFLLPGITDAVAILGGRIQNSGPSGQTPVNYATNSFQSCFAAATPPTFAWANGAPMGRARYHSNATICPDASVMIFGGHIDVTSNAGSSLTSVLTPERYFAGMLTSMAPGVSSRNYHSTTLLLPDGSILVAGGEGRSSDYELFLPPYLACIYPRPVITASPPVINYTQNYSVTFSVPSGTVVQKAVLMRPGSVTHHTDYDQRYVDLELEVVDNAAGILTFNAPASPNLAPRGYYMLFLVANKGTPSLASWVLLQ